MPKFEAKPKFHFDSPQLQAARRARSAAQACILSLLRNSQPSSSISADSFDTAQPTTPDEVPIEPTPTTSRVSVAATTDAAPNAVAPTIVGTLAETPCQNGEYLNGELAKTTIATLEQDPGNEASPITPVDSLLTIFNDNQHQQHDYGEPTVVDHCVLLPNGTGELNTEPAAPSTVVLVISPFGYSPF